MLGSAVVAVGLIFGVIFSVFISRPVGLGIFALTGLFFLLALWKDHHHHGPLEEAVERWGWFRQRLSGGHLYIPGHITQIGDWPVPGVGAKSTLTQAEDVFGHSYALITYPQVGHHVLNMQANPDGAALADAIFSDQQDSKFSEWQASLGNEADLEQLAITMEIAPDAYPAVKREIDKNLDKGAPALSQQMLQDCVKMYAGQGGATSKSYITMTFSTPSDADSAEVKADGGAAAMRESLATRIPDLLRPIPATGAGPVTLMTGDDVVRVVRCAYNPGDRALYQELHANGESTPVILWSSAGPAGSEESKDSYEHGDGRSITWGTTGFIGAQVASRVMKPLVKDPPMSVHTLRITWLYKPISPAKSGFIAEADHRAAKQRKRSGSKDPSERVVADADAAARTRKAEAQGKGLLNFACLITATVLEQDDEAGTAKAVKRAKSGIEHQTPAAKLHTRVMRRAQAYAFAQACGYLGLSSSAHLFVPTSVRKAG
jgi:hypothetical protein